MIAVTMNYFLKKRPSRRYLAESEDGFSISSLLSLPAGSPGIKTTGLPPTPLSVSSIWYSKVN